jgi:peptide/nickel transport system substrate-binding protein
VSARSRHVLVFTAFIGAGALCLLPLVWPGGADAASRGRYGGTLRVALHGTLHDHADPLLADAPHEAGVLALGTRGVCRLERDGRVTPVLALDLARESPSSVRVTLRPNLRAADGTAVTAQELAQAWMRPSQPQSLSPYRALLFPLRGEGRHLGPSSTYQLPLALAFPWPDLERSLCHPALALAPPAPRGVRHGVGAFLPARALGVFVANPHYPGGRPYVDRLTLTAGDAQALRRVLQLGEAETALGATATGYEPAAPPPALFATWLAFRPERAGAGVGAAVERVVDRNDLARFFLQPPAVAMSQLLPPALMPQEPVPPPSRPPAPAPARELTLLYDLGLSDQRGVAERLQVRLHDAGYKVALRGVSRSELRARWASGDFDLMLHALLLPPAPAAALAVVLDAAGRRDLLPRELPALGALAEDRERDQKARERARALQPELHLVPLYAQGVRWVTARGVASAESDAHGVPQLDDLFFTGGR